MSEQPYFAKVSKSSPDAVPDETVTTVKCTSKSDPVTENVQIDKQNSKIVVSSVVFEGQQQTEPKMSERKFSPVPPRRSHASKTERSKIVNIEQTTASDHVKIVETSSVSSEHKIEDQICLSKTPSPSQAAKTDTSAREIKLPNIEHVSNAEQVSEKAQVQIVETSYVTKSPQTEPKPADHVCLPKDQAKENKISNVESTSKSDKVSEYAQVNKVVETSFVSKSPPAEHKVPEQICLPKAPTQSQVPDKQEGFFNLLRFLRAEGQKVVLYPTETAPKCPVRPQLRSDQCVVFRQVLHTGMQKQPLASVRGQALP